LYDGHRGATRVRRFVYKSMPLKKLSAMFERASRRTPCALLCAAGLLPALAGCGSGAPSPTPPAAKAAITRERTIRSLGRLEPAGGIIDVSALPGERLEYLAPKVAAGAVVPAGAELGRLGSYALRKAQLDAVIKRKELADQQRSQELAVAEATVKKAEAARAQAEAKAAEVQAQQAKLQNLQDAADIARQDLALVDELRSSDLELLTEQQARRKRNLANRVIKEFEAAQLAYLASEKAAAAALALADQNVKFAEASFERAREINQADAIAMEVIVAEQALEQSVLRAPKATDGSKDFTILKVATKPGGFVTQIPILQLGDLTRMVCIAEVYEADAKEISLGQEATIHSRAFAGDFATSGLKGEVVEIGTVITGPGLTNRNPLAQGDRSIVEVVIAIDPENKNEDATEEAARRIGLQVKVDFGAKKGQSAAGASAP
jgi:HlyD family secretion protein